MEYLSRSILLYVVFFGVNAAIAVEEWATITVSASDPTVFSTGETAVSSENSSSPQNLESTGAGNWLYLDPPTPIESRVDLRGASTQIDDAIAVEINLKSEDIADNAVWNRDFKSFFTISNTGVVRKIRFPELVEELRIELRIGIRRYGEAKFVLTSEALIVLDGRSGSVLLLNPNTLALENTISIGTGVESIDASPAGPFVFGHKRDVLIVLDTRKSGRASEYRSEELLARNRPKRAGSSFFGSVAVSADAQYLLLGAADAISLFQVGDGRLSFQRICHGAQLIGVSNDPLYFLASQGAVKKIFNRDDLSKPAVELPTDLLMVGLDKIAGRIYGFKSNSGLAVFHPDGRFRREYDLGGFRRYSTSYSSRGLGGMLVYPGGSNILLLNHSLKLWVQFQNEVRQ